MRITLSSSARAYALAKTLRSLLRREGAPVRLGHSQAILAGMLGYDSWAELLLVTERRDTPASPFDEACPAAIVEERIAFQVTRLMRDCIPTLDGASAAFVVATLAPCARPSQRPKPIREALVDVGVAQEASEHASKPAFVQALTPREWLHRNGIRFSGTVIRDHDACSDAIAGQVSRPWGGLDALTGPVRVLAYVFALHMNRHGREFEGLRDAQAFAMMTGDAGDHEKVARMMRSHEGNRSLRAAIEMFGNEHAYVETVMARLLGEARKRSGLLASAEFLWLKGVDRGLWYALHNVGRREFHIEGFGAMIHLSAEQAAGRGLTRIDAAPALDGIRAYLAKTDAVPELAPARAGHLRLRANHFISLA